MSPANAWADFHDRMKAVGERINESDFPDDPRLRAEGYRYLARLQQFALQWYLEFFDPVHPAFFRFGDDVVKWGGTNADNNYLRARVEPSGTYRISGNTNGVRELYVSLHDGEMVFGQIAVLQERSLGDLEVGADGSLEILLGGPERTHNWIPLDPSAQLVLIRQFVADWEHGGIADLRIDRIDDRSGEIAAPLSEESVTSGLDRAATWVEKSATFWNDHCTNMRDVMTDNTLTPPFNPPGGAVNTLIGAGFWNLGPDEALLIDCETPQAQYWSIQLVGPAWMEPPDFANRVTSLNNTQVHTDDDGRFRMVLSHSDPGIQNWLDTTGLTTGMIGYRWVRPSNAPVPSTEVVKVDDLRQLLATVPAFTAEDRHQQITRRRAGVARRFRR